MGANTSKNLFGASAATGGADLQRTDLFRVVISPPASIITSAQWGAEIQMAVAAFPFPEREKEIIAVKYLQQVNQLVGGDKATGQVKATFRYPFAYKTAKLLERWFWATSNPLTGGTCLTSQLKGSGYVEMLIPQDISGVVADLADSVGYNGMSAQAQSNDPYVVQQRWYLEGIWPSNFTMTELNMEGSKFVECAVTFVLDRYYMDTTI